MKKILLLLPDGRELHDVEISLRGQLVTVIPTQTVKHALEVLKAQKIALMVMTSILDEPGETAVKLTVRTRSGKNQDIKFLVLLPEGAASDVLSRDQSLVRPFTRDELVAKIFHLLATVPS